MRLVRRWSVAAGLVAVLLAGGCGNPGGVDGNLTNGWAAMGVPAAFTPSADTCHLANFAVSGPRSAYEVVDCKIKHRTETVHVGTYTGPAAEAAKPPEAGSAGAQAAYRVCDGKTEEYVGNPWRTARLWIGVTNPSQEAWSGGARWYRCEVLESSSVEDDGGLVQRLGSLRDALVSPTSSLLLTCYAIILDRDGKIDKMPAATCGSSHNAEFAGIWEAGEDTAYPATTAAWDTFHKGCRGVIAAYVKVPNDADLQYRAGVVSLPGGEDVWAMGDRGVRCYLWVDTAPLTASLRGKGTKALPVQYQ